MNTDDIKRFVGRLRALSHPGAMDRGALATLRRGVLAPESDYRVLSVIGPWIPSAADPWTLRCYAYVACLYALNPHEEPIFTIGGASRRLRESVGSVGGKSLDQLVTATLDSKPDDLFHYIRHLSSRMASAKPPIGLNYHRLLQDLLTIGSGPEGERETKRRWAFHYWNVFDDTIKATKDKATTHEHEEEPA